MDLEIKYFYSVRVCLASVLKSEHEVICLCAGFSRGAYQVRVLAAMIHSVGAMSPPFRSWIDRFPSARELGGPHLRWKSGADSVVSCDARRAFILNIHTSLVKCVPTLCEEISVGPGIQRSIWQRGNDPLRGSLVCPCVSGFISCLNEIQGHRILRRSARKNPEVYTIRTQYLPIPSCSCP